MTDRMGGIGLEHHRSAENQFEPTALTDWEAMDWDHNVVSHELVHSWNGKFRRPADLWTPDYRTPMQNSLLWLYEGQTQFRSEEHTSEIQSIRRISTAVLWLTTTKTQ